ncbi:hypothetical protein HPB52_015212 [Rhipicephalus sanguineus]|uniref:C2HC/C3H-type domain-containing protein n=1 Tax=Rhipicephalus sanguineus TaxID=34632 RepID=A0A9D4SUK9_RHISA|nr:hypothetical protein HPB52_015212 [Rhipicephalus sanguineus]
MLSAHHARRFDALQRRCPDGYADGNTSEVFLVPSRRESCSRRAGSPQHPRGESHNDVETRGGPLAAAWTTKSGYVECPSCNRNFSDRAADRHIAWCQERKSRIPKSPASAEAVERLKARTKYKVPTPGKKNGTVSPSGSQGSKEGGSGKVAVVNRNHQRTKSSPSMLDTNGTTANKAKKPIVRYPSDDSYDPYKKADMQMRELIRGSTLMSKNPRTVPGVRTGGLNSNSINGNLSDSNSYTSTNSGSENKLDEEMNYLNAKFAELSRPGFTGEFTNNWAKRMNDNAVAVHSLSDRDVHVSSSGSDGSLPSVGHGLETKVPYLCHQCGTMYPVTVAKYCCECGARRLGYISLYA